MKLQSLARQAAPHPDKAASGLSPLAEHPEIVHLRAQISQVQNRLDETLRRRERALRASRGGKVARPNLERARDLIAGGIIPSASPSAEYGATVDEETILRGALNDLTNEFALVSSRLSHTASLSFAAKHESALRRFDEALETMFDAVEEMQGIVVELHKLGYAPSHTVLGANLPRGAFLIGSPKTVGTDGWMFREWLKKNFG